MCQNVSFAFAARITAVSCENQIFKGSSKLLNHRVWETEFSFLRKFTLPAYLTATLRGLKMIQDSQKLVNSAQLEITRTSWWQSKIEDGNHLLHLQMLLSITFLSNKYGSSTDFYYQTWKPEFNRTKNELEYFWIARTRTGEETWRIQNSIRKRDWGRRKRLTILRRWNYPISSVLSSRLLLLLLLIHISASKKKRFTQACKTTDWRRERSNFWNSKLQFWRRESDNNEENQVSREKEEKQSAKFDSKNEETCSTLIIFKLFALNSLILVKSFI